MRIFIIVKSAIYMHDIIGIFSSIETAKEFFQSIYMTAKNETDKDTYHHDFDGHHAFDLYSSDLDKGNGIERIERLHYEPFGRRVKDCKAY